MRRVWSGCCATTATTRCASWPAGFRRGKKRTAPSPSVPPSTRRCASPRASRPELRAERDEVLAVAEGPQRRPASRDAARRDLRTARSRHQRLETAFGIEIARRRARRPDRFRRAALIARRRVRSRPRQTHDRLVRKRRFRRGLVSRASRRGFQRRRRLRRLLDGMEPRQFADRAERFEREVRPSGIRRRRVAVLNRFVDDEAMHAEFVDFDPAELGAPHRSLPIATAPAATAPTANAPAAKAPAATAPIASAPKAPDSVAMALIFSNTEVGSLHARVVE